MTCRVCRRMVRGFGHSDGSRFHSYKCLKIYSHAVKTMTDFTADEKAALLAGGAAGAEYLGSINEYRLDKLSGDQALTFLEVTFARYHEAMVERETAKFP